MSAPIRVRLTAWYALLLALVLTAIGTFVVTRLRADLTDELDRGLRSGAARIAEGYRAEGDSEFRDVARTVLPGPFNRGSGAQVLAPGGRVLLSVGDPVTRTPLIDEDAVPRVLAGRSPAAEIHRGGPTRRHLRTVALRVQRRGRREALVVVESLAGVDRAVHRVLVLLLLGGAGSLALVAAGGWWIARKALRPVERMTTRADEIGIDRLGERIAVPRVNDEVGHLARTLNAMLARLQEGVEARQRLVADASHELRAPLAAMRSEIEVSLRQDDHDAAARAVLESARVEVIRMGRVVDDLLTLARVSEGQLELLVAPQDLRELVDDALSAHRSAAEAAGVALVASGDPVTVAGDRDRLGHVIGNLVDNAIKYAPAGGEVAVEVARAPGGRGRVTVSDAGPGIPPDQRERVFERFARLDPARSRRGGAGLGLAICAEIVHAHGGRIWVEPRAPRGSTFVVELAALAPDAARAEAAASAASARRSARAAS